MKVPFAWMFHKAALLGTDGRPRPQARHIPEIFARARRRKGSNHGAHRASSQSAPAPMGLYAQVAHPCRHEHELRTTSLHAARHWEVTGIATVVPNWTLRANRAPFARLMGRSNAPRVAAAHVVCRFHPAVGRIQRHRGSGAGGVLHALCRRRNRVGVHQ
jgi:hypothetical protein